MRTPITWPSRITGRWWTLASSSAAQASCTGIEPSTLRSGRERIRESGGVGAEPLRQHPHAEVTVGHDAGRLPADQDRRDPLLGHDPGRVPHRGGLVHPDGGAADERLHRRRQVDAEGGDRRVLQARLEPGGEAGGEVAGEAGVGEQPVELLARDPVGEQVLLDDAVEGGLPGDEGGVAEGLALLEDLEGLAGPLEPHHPLADHVEVPERFLPHGHELRARRVVDDLQALRGTVEQFRREAVERGAWSGRTRPGPGPSWGRPYPNLSGSR